MARTDGNKIALHALRVILDAPVPDKLTIAGKKVLLEARRDERSDYPREAHGLEPEVDGPWPPPLHVTASWDSGKAAIDVRVVAPGSGDTRGMVGVEAVISRQQLVGITLPNLLAHVADGQRYGVPGHATVFRRAGEDGRMIDQLKADQRRQLWEHGLEFKGKSVRLFDLVPPDPAPLPSPEIALRNILLTALIKMPYFARSNPALIEGSPLFSVSPGAGDGPAEQPQGVAGNRRACVWPLPGGVRSYARALDVVLGWLGEAPRTRQAVAGFLEERFGVTAKGDLVGHVNFMVHVGVAEWTEGQLQPTSEGETYLDLTGPDRALYLFDLVHSRFTGLIEALVITRHFQPTTRAQMSQLLPQVLGMNWETGAQVQFRRNWLLSLGLTERDEGDSVTVLGERVLAKYTSAVVAANRGLARLGVTLADLEASSAEASPSEVPPPALSLELVPERIERHLAGLSLPGRLVEMASVALSLGHHLLLVGPPGTGKTELAIALATAARAEDYASDFSLVTASADWTTFDTIGGYALEPGERGERMVFKPGVFVSAIENDRWLVIDELNRADVDKAFGELMTVLSGRGVTTAFRLTDGRAVSLGQEGDSSRPPEGWSHPISPTFRLLATMNTWDKTSLFRLSYALQRRFAVLHVDVPDDDTYADLLIRAAKKESAAPPLADEALRRLRELFSQEGLLGLRAVGPAIALDIVRYARRRPGADGLAEALELFLLPQLEGLDPSPARQVRERVVQALGGGLSASALGHFDALYMDLFPSLEAP